MDVFAGIITFNPDIFRLRECISSIMFQVDQVVIIDNFSKNIMEIKKLSNTLNDNITIICNDNNSGVANALNQLFSWGDENGYKYVLTLDQDSKCPNQIISILKSYICRDKVAVVGPQIYDRNKGETICNKEGYTEVDNCITSGSMSSIDAWKNIGGFDEWMFIDGVDFDYCFRLRQDGYKIYQINNIVLEHQIGNIQIRHFLFCKVVVRNHSSFRKYYIARNIIYFDKKNKHKKIPLKATIRVMKQMLLVVLYEKQKMEKLKRLCDGFCDGMKSK